MSGKSLFKVVFLYHNKVYEIFAGGVCSSDMYGFIEVSELQFDLDDSVVIDPTEDRLREEFADTEYLHLPMHSILRIEQVKRRGQSKIRDRESGEKVTPFPVPGQRRSDK